VRAAAGNKRLVMNNSPLVISSGLEKQSNLYQPRFVGRSVSVGLGLQCVYFVREGGSSILREELNLVVMEAQPLDGTKYQDSKRYNDRN
jgi:hypothetical protein